MLNPNNSTIKIFLLIPNELLVSPGKYSQASGKRAKNAKSKGMSLYFSKNSSNCQNENNVTDRFTDFQDTFKITGSMNNNAASENLSGSNTRDSGTTPTIHQFKPFVTEQSQAFCR
jgi:hypothetical protein